MSAHGLPGVRTKAPIRWAAELSGVREVSLEGAADLAFWRGRLAPLGLEPAAAGGEARVMVLAGDARFLGVRFRELSFCVLLQGRGAWREGGYLLGAFNSRRFFAFCERTFFSTPYRHGDVRVSVTAPAGMEVSVDGRVPFRAAMGHRDVGPLDEGGWEGPVFLPPRARGPARVFFARLRGPTFTAPFDPSVDALALAPGPGDDAIRALADSGFRATGWVVRESAVHAKSKTYETSKVFPGEP